MIVNIVSPTLYGPTYSSHVALPPSFFCSLSFPTSRDLFPSILNVSLNSLTMAPMRLAVPRPDATFDDWEKFILHLFDQGWICNENLCVWKAPVEFVHVIAGKEVHYPVSGARFNFQLPRLIRNQFRGHKSSTLHFAGDFPRGVTTLDATAIHLPGPLDTDNQQALLATSTETDNASSQESAPPTTAVADQQAPLSVSAMTN